MYILTDFLSPDFFLLLQAQTASAHDFLGNYITITWNLINIYKQVKVFIRKQWKHVDSFVQKKII